MNARLASMILTLFVSTAFAQETPERHVTWTLDACASCHSSAEVEKLIPRLSRPCRELCVSCHRMTGHHRIGVPIRKPVRPPLLLTEGGTNTCSTCHDLTMPARAKTVWVTQSLVTRLLDRSREHKTYYLALRNDRGQLCRNCH